MPACFCFDGASKIICIKYVNKKNLTVLRHSNQNRCVLKCLYRARSCFVPFFENIYFALRLFLCCDRNTKKKIGYSLVSCLIQERCAMHHTCYVHMCTDVCVRPWIWIEFFSECIFFHSNVVRMYRYDVTS